MEDNEKETETVQEKNIKTRIKVISIIVIILFIMGLGIAAYYIQSFSFVWFIIIVGIGLVLFAIAFFFTKIKDFLMKTKDAFDDKKIPNAITQEECITIRDKHMMDTFGDRVNIIHSMGSPHHGKISQAIFYTIFTGEFKDKKTNQQKVYFFGLNMHYPERREAVVISSPEHNVYHFRRRLAIDPEPAPEKEIIKERSDLLGIDRIIEKPVHKKPEKKKEKESDI